MLETSGPSVWIVVGPPKWIVVGPPMWILCRALVCGLCTQGPRLWNVQGPRCGFCAGPLLFLSFVARDLSWIQWCYVGDSAGLGDLLASCLRPPHQALMAP
jgi:hypothetical protein